MNNDKSLRGYIHVVEMVSACLARASRSGRRAVCHEPSCKSSRQSRRVNGKLAPCPASPNCVSTQADDAEHRIDAIRFTGSATDVLPKLKRAIATLPRAVVITEAADYLHVECTSLLFRFTDDVEFWIDEPNRVIHFRSASRVGHGDLGANRKRMEAIRQGFEKMECEV